MADSSNYGVAFRRRREQKTDYKQRKQLLKSGETRAVVRLSNNHTRVQLVDFNREGDENTAQTFSGELEEYGWDQHNGNLPAAYLTGFLAGMKSDKDSAILDKGMRSLNKEGRKFAALKGLIDAGVEVPVGDDVFPPEKRLQGEHIEEMKDADVVKSFQEVKENIEEELGGQE